MYVRFHCAISEIKYLFSGATKRLRPRGEYFYLKGLFTIFLFSVRSHILSRNGVCVAPRVEVPYGAVSRGPWGQN